MPGDRPSVLVLGIGNAFCGDDGFGVRCADELVERYRMHPRVRVIDGGTQGLYLLPWVQEADRLLIFDAVDAGLEPGTMRVAEGAEVAQVLAARWTSCHRRGLLDVLAGSALGGRGPRATVLVGVQPAAPELLGRCLTPAVAARVPEAVAVAADWLRRWGTPPRPTRAALRRAFASRLRA